jgi:AcrR family transcriptional regulator
MKERLTRAQKRERTYEELILAAEKLFAERGFHATSVDEIAFEAGYTKGAVYSNFESKEELFFAVYERRAERGVAEVERVLRENGPAAGLELLASDAARRRGGMDDGWLAVYFEFWAHVVRRPELRERFARIHGRVAEPMTAAVERLAEERGISMPVEARSINVAMIAMVSGLSLERLTQPDVVDVSLGARMVRLVLEDLGRDGAMRAPEDRKEWR